MAIVHVDSITGPTFPYKRGITTNVCNFGLKPGER